MTYHERVMAVLSPVDPLNQVQVVRAAQMDWQTCRHILIGLVASGQVTREIIRNGKQGRPAHHYRLAPKARTEAAA